MLNCLHLMRTKRFTWGVTSCLLLCLGSVICVASDPAKTPMSASAPLRRKAPVTPQLSNPSESPSAEETPPEPESVLTAAEVADWVAKLSSDVYAERITASRKLRGSGLVGVEALARAAKDADPEVSVRAIQLLTSLYESRNPEVAIAADDALESLGESGPPAAVVRTQEVLSSTLAPLRRRHAIAAIKRLGGHVIPTREFDDEGLHEVEADLNKEGTVQHIVLGKKWTGGVAGIKYLQRLPELRTLYITNAIPLTMDEQGLLKEKLSGVRVEYRGSAFLGIKSLIQDPEICIVDSVVPDSPAQRGGLLKDDVITHLDGLRVHGFTDLTDGLKVKQGGDTVYLEVLRGDDALEISVILGEW